MKKQEKLPKAFKKKWVNALLSGEFEQGKENLHSGGKYCCLGVACAIEGIDTGDNSWIYDVLDPQGKIPSVLYYKIGNGIVYELTDLNDAEVPFEVIAGVIDEWL